MKNKILELGQKLAFCLPPEAAHSAAVKALKAGLVPNVEPIVDPRLMVSKKGLEFQTPLGIAAGFDKNAEVPDALLKMGFGFSEVGTITPLPQKGNPKPRIFRLKQHQGVINRLGFNNEGAQAAHARLIARQNNSGLVGVNIGANKTSENRIEDYAWGIRNFYDLAGYFTVNISSPNTPGLRDLQGGGELGQLLEQVDLARKECADVSGREVPTFLKIAPDMELDQLAEIIALVQKSDFEGLIVSNTTISRGGVEDHQNASQMGGLSGRPLFNRSTALLAHARKLLGPEPLLIGVGGVTTGDDVVSKIEAGADVVQLYTGFIYRGPAIVSEASKALLAACDAQGLNNVGELTSTKNDEWCDMWAR